MSAFKIHYSNASLKKQNGAVLIVGLIMMFVMTLISVASISSSVLQTQMSTNYRDRQVAFQAAEAALRRGERLTATHTSKADYSTTCADGLCLSDLQANPPIPNAYYWLDPTIWSTGGKHITFPVTGTATDAKIIIEHMGHKISDFNVGVQVTTDPMIFRVTAIGYGRTVNSRVMLQSTFILPPS